ncbi:MAG: hypothetical protein KG075_05945 [Alphaproteobacteria bacterium]|nr:hypothetical protein [Alphaproteobacteria bacterium]
MNPIDEIRTRLLQYPDVQYVASTDTLRMEAPQDGGFPIYIRRHAAAGWDVTFGEGLQCHFDDAAAATEFFSFGLSDQCRLREIRRGSVVHRACAERRKGDGWEVVQETIRLLYPFWRRPSEYIFQNILLSPGSQE